MGVDRAGSKRTPCQSWHKGWDPHQALTGLGQLCRRWGYTDLGLGEAKSMYHQTLYFIPLGNIKRQSPSALVSVDFFSEGFQATGYTGACPHGGMPGSLLGRKEPRTGSVWLWASPLVSLCMCVNLLQSCPALSGPIDCSLPGFSVHGILQARILEWVAMPSSRRSSWPRDWTPVSSIAGRFFTVWATREATQEGRKVNWNTDRWVKT